MANTGFDRIAQHLISNGITVGNTNGHNGHYSPIDIATAIQNIVMSPPTFSKSCSIQSRSSAFGNYVELVVGGVTLIDGARDAKSGSFSINASGNITEN